MPHNVPVHTVSTALTNPAQDTSSIEPQHADVVTMPTSNLRMSKLLEPISPMSPISMSSRNFRQHPSGSQSSSNSSNSIAFGVVQSSHATATATNSGEASKTVYSRDNSNNGSMSSNCTSSSATESSNSAALDLTKRQVQNSKELNGKDLDVFKKLQEYAFVKPSTDFTKSPSQAYLNHACDTTLPFITCTSPSPNHTHVPEPKQDDRYGFSFLQDWETPRISKLANVSDLTLDAFQHEEPRKSPTTPKTPVLPERSKVRDLAYILEKSLSKYKVQDTFKDLPQLPVLAENEFLFEDDSETQSGRTNSQQEWDSINNNLHIINKSIDKWEKIEFDIQRLLDLTDSANQQDTPMTGFNDSYPRTQHAVQPLLPQTKPLNFVESTAKTSPSSAKTMKKPHRGAFTAKALNKKLPAIQIHQHDAKAQAYATAAFGQSNESHVNSQLFEEGLNANYLQEVANLEIKKPQSGSTTPGSAMMSGSPLHWKGNYAAPAQPSNSNTLLVPDSHSSRFYRPRFFSTSAVSSSHGVSQFGALQRSKHLDQGDLTRQDIERIAAAASAVTAETFGAASNSKSETNLSVSYVFPNTSDNVLNKQQSHSGSSSNNRLADRGAEGQDDTVDALPSASRHAKAWRAKLRKNSVNILRHF